MVCAGCVKNFCAFFKTLLRNFSKVKTEECDQKNRSFSYKFRMLMAGSDTYFLEVSAQISLKLLFVTCFREKETTKIKLSRLFF